MKARTSATWKAGLVLALISAWLPDGRTQTKADPASTSIPNVPSAPAPATPGPALTPRTAPLEFLTPPGGLFNMADEPQLPPGIHLSYWTGEMVKLALAGIDESVMLAFLDDAGTFNLGADQIIYLSDLGMPNRVVAAMLQHDFEFAAGNRPATAWIMPSSKPAIQLVFTTNSAPTAPAVNPPAAASVATSGNSSSTGAPAGDSYPVVDERFADSGFLPLDSAWSADTASPAWSATEEKRKLYAVREPHPVKLTDPILMFRAPVRIPNVVVVELFP